MINQLAYTPKKLEDEIFTSFNLTAENYLEDDIRWGDDTDLIYFQGKKLQHKLGRLIDIFYPGVGPGRILVQILTKRQFFRKITAIDYSPNMIELSQRNLAKLIDLEPEVKDWVELKLGNLLHFKEHEKYDMALLLNNTLGNIVVNDSGELGRKAALEILNNVLRPGGILFFSVYNITKIRLLNGFYTPKLKIERRLNEQDFLLELSIKGEKHLLYSHWFTVEEIKDLISKMGYTLLWVAERKERIIVCAEKR